MKRRLAIKQARLVRRRRIKTGKSIIVGDCYDVIVKWLGYCNINRWIEMKAEIGNRYMEIKD